MIRKRKCWSCGAKFAPHGAATFTCPVCVAQMKSTVADLTQQRDPAEVRRCLGCYSDIWKPNPEAAWTTAGGEGTECGPGVSHRPLPKVMA